MEQLEKVENSAVQIEDMVKEILKDRLQSLDNYIEQVKICFLDNNEILDQDIALIIEKIPIYLYDLIVFTQQIEMRKGLSKEHSKYAQNEALISVTGTVAERQAKAENFAASDRLTQLAYTTASSIVTSKINGATAILDSAKKIQQSRMLEKKLTAQTGNAVT